MKVNQDAMPRHSKRQVRDGEADAPQKQVVHCFHNGTRQGDAFFQGMDDHIRRLRLPWHLSRAIPSLLPEFLRNPHGSLGGLGRPSALVGFIPDFGGTPLPTPFPPIITCSQRTTDLPGLVRVLPDDASIGRIAARHLLDCGYRRCAMWGGDLPARERRFTVFAETVRSAGAVCTRLVPQTPDHIVEAFLALVRAGPGPLAVFCHQDRDAAFVRDLCHTAGTTVPDEVAILGVDDDAAICLESQPHLSSVIVPWRSIGRRAAELLHARLSGAELPKVARLPSLRVAARTSTGRVPNSDRQVEKILRLIDNQPHRQWTLAALATSVAMAPRSLQRRLQAAGVNLRQLLLARRLDAFEERLAGSDLPLGRLQTACGFNSRQALHRAFTARHGRGPAAWRNDLPPAINDGTG